MGGCQSSKNNPSGTIDCWPCERCCSAILQLPLIYWLTNLEEIERCRVAGILLSCVGTIFMTIAISTEFWVKSLVRGIFVFRGLWIECQMGSCAPPEKFHMYAVGSIILMLISVLASYLAVIFGTLCFIRLPQLKLISWRWLATYTCFISGVTGALSLYNFMRNATKETDTFLSWSLVAGWLAVCAIFIAGICYFWASRLAKEQLYKNRCKSRTLLSLGAHRRLMEADSNISRMRDEMSDTSTCM